MKKMLEKKVKRLKTLYMFQTLIFEFPQIRTQFSLIFLKVSRYTKKEMVKGHEGILEKCVFHQNIKM